MKYYFALKCCLIVLVFTFPGISCVGKAAEQINGEPQPVRTESERPRTPSSPTEILPLEDRLVTPGVGTSMVRLGMGREELVKLWGEPADEYNHSGTCKYSEIHWLPADKGAQGDGVFVFLREGKVFEVRFGQGFHTPDGLEVNLPLSELKTRTTGKMFQIN